jgi:phage repressor protein C with HTH and peptisase S24 domain
MDTFADRVRATRLERGMSQAQLATASGISQSTIAQIESSRNKGTKNIVELARALKVNPQWLLRNEGPKTGLYLPALTGMPEGEDALTQLDQAGGGIVTWEKEEDLPADEDRAWIDRYDYHFSAGTGLIQWEVREKKALPFNRAFFRALGSDPKNCRLLVTRGDSQEPFLFNRDLFMVDVTRTRIKDGAMYAIYFEDEPLVKRVFKQAGGGLVLNSYNATKYPDKYIQPDKMEYVRIVGEVIYRSGSGPAGGN